MRRSGKRTSAPEDRSAERLSTTRNEAVSVPEAVAQTTAVSGLERTRFQRVGCSGHGVMQDARIPPGLRVSGHRSIYVEDGRARAAGVQVRRLAEMLALARQNELSCRWGMRSRWDRTGGRDRGLGTCRSTAECTSCPCLEDVKRFGDAWWMVWSKSTQSDRRRR
jgi:hypothetical protein